MKKNLSIYGILLAALTLAGCSKDGAMPSPETPDAPEMVVLALDAPATRTSLTNDTKINWTAGDRINVNGIPYGILIDENGKATVEVVKADSYRAVYPAANFTKAVDSNNPDTLALPAKQSYVEGTFADNVNPMVAYSTGGALNFHSICGVVKLTLTGEDIPISSIELRDNNGGKLSGTFTLSGIETGNPTLTGVDNKPDSVVLSFLSYQQPVLTKDKPLDFYIVVPANEGNQLYQNGFTVRITTDDGDVISQSSSDNMTVKASDVIRMPTFEVIPPVQAIYFKADDATDWTSSLPASVTSKLSVKTADGSFIKKSVLTAIDALLVSAAEPIDLDMGDAAYFADALDYSLTSNARKKVRSIIYPKNVTSVGSFAYQSATVEKMVFPATLTKVGSMCFYNCTALSTLVFKSATPPEAGSSTFTGMGKNVDEADRKIYVPDATAVETYKASARWSDLVEGSGTSKFKYNFLVGAGE